MNLLGDMEIQLVPATTAGGFGQSYVTNDGLAMAVLSLDMVIVFAVIVWATVKVWIHRTTTK